VLETIVINWSRKGIEYPLKTILCLLASFDKRTSSARLFPNPINKDKRVVTIYNHGENLSTSIKETPAATLITNPAAMKVVH